MKATTTVGVFAGILEGDSSNSNRNDGKLLLVRRVIESSIIPGVSF